MLRTRLVLLATALAVLLPSADALAAPANDERADAIALPVGGGALNGTNVGATSDDWDDDDRVGTGTHSVWYRYAATQSGRLTVAVSAGAFDATLTAYEQYVTCCRWDGDDDNGDGTNPVLTLDVKTGNEYFFLVDGYRPDHTGTFTITAGFDANPGSPANDAMTTPRPLGGGVKQKAVGYHHFATTQAGEPVHTASGTERSLWYQWTPGQSGGTNVWASCGSTSVYLAHRPVIKVYTGTPQTGLTPVSPTATGSTACPGERLQFQAVQGTTYRIAVALEPGSIVGATQLQIDQDTTPTKVTFGSESTYAKDATIGFGTDGPVSETHCKLDTQPIVQCGGGFKLSDPPGTDHVLDVRTIDKHGNVSEWHDKAFKIDRAAPQTEITGGPSGPTKQTSATVTFKASEADAAFECRQATSGPFTPCTSPLTIGFTSNGQSRHVEVRAKDKFGNTDASPAKRSWTVDTLAPTVFLDGGEPYIPAGQPMTWKFHADEPGVSFACAMEYTDAFVPCGSPFTIPGAPIATTHHVTVRATDPAGNVKKVTWRGHQTQPKLPWNGTGGPTPPTNGSGSSGTGRAAGGTTGTTGTGVTVRTGALRVTLRATRRVSRRALARRGLTAAVGCEPACRVRVELRRNGKVLAQASTRASARRSVRLRPSRTAARRIAKLRPGTKLTLSVKVDGVVHQQATLKLAR